MATVVAKCTNKDCVSDFQDRVYGNGVRVHNVTKDGRRCTVCGNAVRVSVSVKVEEKA